MDFDWLRDGAPLLLEWVSLRQADGLQRAGLLPAMEKLRRGETLQPEDHPADPGLEEGLALRVLAALMERRVEPLRHYVESLQDATGELPGLSADLLQWQAWAALATDEALRRLTEGLPADGGSKRLLLFAQGWRQWQQGRGPQAALEFQGLQRQALSRGLLPLGELARRAAELARSAGASKGCREPARAPGDFQPGPRPGWATAVPPRADQERLRRREACFLACHRFGRMVGASPPFLELMRKLEEAARDRLPLLLVGETGTGKELAVEYLHGLAFAEGAPLVAVNCGGLNDSLAEAELFGSARGAFTGAVAREGLAAQAEGGTLFLDEFGALPPAVQARLLRFLESGVFRPVGEARERRVTVRLVAATCERERLGAGHFRQDLLHRVAGRVIEVPALERRLEDLPLLARAFLHEAGVVDPAAHPACAPAALARLRRASWPGNIRQLRHLMQRLSSLTAAQVEAELRLLGEASARTTPADTTRPTDGAGTPEGLPLREALARFEWTQIQHALAAAGQDKRLAARRLGISLPTLYARLRGAGRPLSPALKPALDMLPRE